MKEQLNPFEKRGEEVKKEKRKKFGEKMEKKEAIDTELQELIDDLTDEEKELAEEVGRKNSERPYGGQ